MASSGRSFEPVSQQVLLARQRPLDLWRSRSNLAARAGLLLGRPLAGLSPVKLRHRTNRRIARPATTRFATSLRAMAGEASRSRPYELRNRGRRGGRIGLACGGCRDRAAGLGATDARPDPIGPGRDERRPPLVKSREREPPSRGRRRRCRAWSVGVVEQRSRRPSLSSGRPSQRRSTARSERVRTTCEVALPRQASPHSEGRPCGNREQNVSPYLPHRAWRTSELESPIGAGRADPPAVPDPTRRSRLSRLVHDRGTIRPPLVDSASRARSTGPHAKLRGELSRTTIREPRPSGLPGRWRRPAT